MVPMRDGRQDQFIDIGEDRAKIFASLRCRLGQVLRQPARLDLREHGKLFNMLKVIGDPVDQFVAVFAELLRGHIAQFHSVIRHKGR